MLLQTTPLPQSELFSARSCLTQRVQSKIDSQLEVRNLQKYGTLNTIMKDTYHMSGTMSIEILLKLYLIFM